LTLRQSSAKIPNSQRIWYFAGVVFFHLFCEWKMVKVEEQELSKIRSILDRHGVERGNLIPVLQDIQEAIGYLSDEALKEVERHTGISANEIYGVATFYTQFRFSPPGEHTIVSCQGTACHVRGGQQILRELERRLGVTAGKTTSDGKFDLERVACLGCCALAPVVAVDGKVHAQMSAKKVPQVLARYDNKENTENV